VFVRREHCRSPISQGIFEDVVVRREGLGGEVSVDSAGTGSWHVGEPPYEGAVRSAALRGLDISAQRGRQLRPEDCDLFGYVLMLDEEGYRAVLEFCRGSAVVRFSLDFAPGPPEREVPGQYFGKSDGFEHCLNLAERASEALIEDIRGRNLGVGG
jgi:low molecular weight protein-tyrosine phosphatase